MIQKPARNSFDDNEAMTFLNEVYASLAAWPRAAR
jgi:hypothetical protein